MTSATTTTSPSATGGLSHRRLGVPSVTLMIIAASAPLTVVAGGVTTTFAVTGVIGVPVGFIVLAAALAVFAVGYAAMSRYVTNAGAFYAYIAQGIGRPFGVGASLVALVAYNAMQVGIYGLFGFQMSMFLEAKFGISTPWWLWIFACIVVVGALGVNRVDLSAKVLGILVALEFAAVLVFDLVAFAVAPEGVSTAGLQPAEFLVPGVGAVLSFGVAAFMGFESAAIYGEESKDPKRTVARATYSAVAIIGVFYAFSAWAFTVGIGPSQIVDASATYGPDLMFVFMGQHAPVILSDLMQVLFLTSLFAALQSFHNAVARYLFSLGREGVLHRGLGAVRAGSRAPWAGSVAQSAIAIVVTLGFVVAGEGMGLKSDFAPVEFLYPVLTMFTWLTNTGAMGLVLLMGVIAIAVIGFFRRDRRGLGAWQTLIAPVISAVVLFAVFVLILANFNVLLGQTETTAVTFVLPALLIVPGVVGVVWGMAIRRRNPELYARIGHGLEEAEAAAVAGEPHRGI
ncbi:APC family permease [Agromyces kandeliae]|uniref:Amino acid permease n=1 Tax=Agromyces kandeliae TaxID=2666141 RepID=A0A6L5QX67_9MICO|nr:APC family permease [Agromyces kandeliae]MRX42275.1 amino acid permease [Agromyces kandeliae]